jgi:CheY-specific phosphatase CheX
VLHGLSVVVGIAVSVRGSLLASLVHLRLQGIVNGLPLGDRVQAFRTRDRLHGHVRA